MDTYTHIWPKFHFHNIKTPKTLQFSEAFKNVKKCNIVLNWG